jgi:predicted GNAT family acetyltransferase
MESQSESSIVVHNESKNRFEIALSGMTAYAEYRVEGDRMIFTHTEVPPQFRGRGIAKKLVLAGFNVAGRNNLRIVPLCSYAARVLQEHPEFHGSREKAE